MNSTLRLARYLKPYNKYVVLAPLLMTLEVVLNLLQPRLVQRIVDVGIARLDMAEVIRTGLLMIGTSVVAAVGGMTNGICAELTSQGFGVDVRESLFRRVQAFSFANLDGRETGQLVTRLTNDVTQVQEAIVMVLRMMVRAPLLLVGSLVMGILTAPRLAFLPLALMPVELAALAWIVARATPMFTRVQERLDRLNGTLQENIAGVRVVKAFVREEHEEARFGNANDGLAQTAVRAGRTVAVTQPFLMMTMNLGVIGVLWFGGVRVTQGSMTTGQIISFVNYLTTALWSLMMVSQLVIMLARAVASSRRIREVLDTEPALRDPAEPREWLPVGRVVFEDVTFAYDDGEPVLRGASFTAEPGRTVAILGATGSGKSSLVHLIPRFYDATSGRVLVDGIDVRDLRQEDLRRGIGIALQETVLFSGTVRDNIRWGRPDATDDEVTAAARAAQAHDFITALPGGYDAPVGQRGANLSGGQKQRIAIARALLVRPAVLILDDSTSAVDVETETRIQEALDGPAHPPTRIVIAQRISTVLGADRILVLEDGRIVAEGTHEQLLEKSPIYRDIHDSQLGTGTVPRE
jgi:ATP-binding cassette, subfamily B, multidrug efflux pump